jgi:hypothetical protein
MKKRIIVGAILTTFLLNTIGSLALGVDKDAFRDFIRKEIEAEVGEKIDWKYEVIKDNSIVLKINSLEAMVKGKKATLDAAPFISSEGRTLVPIRFISESMGQDVEWKAETREVVINNSITLQLDNQNAVVYGKNVKLDTAPFIVNGRTVVPVRFISENLGYEVEWKAQTKEVVIRPPIGGK